MPGGQTPLVAEGHPDPCADLPGPMALRGGTPHKRRSPPCRSPALLLGGYCPAYSALSYWHRRASQWSIRLRQPMAYRIVRSLPIRSPRQSRRCRTRLMETGRSTLPMGPPRTTSRPQRRAPAADARVSGGDRIPGYATNPDQILAPNLGTDHSQIPRQTTERTPTAMARGVSVCLSIPEAESADPARRMGREAGDEDDQGEELGAPGGRVPGQREQADLEHDGHALELE